MRINHNIAALNTYRQLSSNTANTQSSLEKLSSGLRINRAGDDAAGLAISEKMRGQIRGLEQAERNAQDGISLIQTAEGALNETHSILQRMRELTVQAGNLGTNSKTEDLKAINDEIDQLAKELNGISDRTEFNGKKLLNGDFASSSLTFQIGANEGQQLSINIDDMSASALGVEAADLGISALADGGDTDAALTALDTAINTVSSQRSELGATQNRLQHTINNLSNANENLTAAESRIRDVDMAKEMMAFTKNNILTQAAQSMLAQANQQPQGVLQLLR
ncbi:flagellin Hag [Radiobacillus deserti]|uniref:Flagellin n=1 Tax=Radiobacillus deserti TaxID=2594883 RepID=A0A516KIQ0_9BACI|nr:flagellin Hag [Radiobacillus deserti]QDP41278.1 flagellin [Radiobacillus deserti]